jgi:hypothetical protein
MATTTGRRQFQRERLLIPSPSGINLRLHPDTDHSEATLKHVRRFGTEEPSSNV